MMSQSVWNREQKNAAAEAAAGEYIPQRQLEVEASSQLNLPWGIDEVAVGGRGRLECHVRLSVVPVNGVSGGVHRRSRFCLVGKVEEVSEQFHFITLSGQQKLLETRNR